MSIRADNRHLYLQVIDKIKQNIEKGIFKEKERLLQSLIYQSS